eukprot:c28987_g1_i1 orf=564-2432(+)
MKSSLRKLRDFALSKHASKGKISTVFSEFLQEHGEVIKGMRDVEDMQAQYEGLLTAAQIISSSAFDFSRSLQDMASYMVETFGWIGDGEAGKAFNMLGKVQYEISKLLDVYAAHVSQTIITPIESLLNELQHVEDMKGQYDEKRQFYNHLQVQKAKGKFKNDKGEIRDWQLLSAKEELDEQAMILGFRLQSFKQGRTLSLITQAVRYHTAQINLFSKALESLNAVEPLAEQLAQELHIDRSLSEGVVGPCGHQNNIGIYGDSLENGDESESIASSPKSLQVSETLDNVDKVEVTMVTLKKWESDSKSAPVFPSLQFQSEDIKSVEEVSLAVPVEKYALPSPLGPLARSDKAAGMFSNVSHASNKVSLPPALVAKTELYPNENSEAFCTLEPRRSSLSVDPMTRMQPNSLFVPSTAEERMQGLKDPQDNGKMSMEPTISRMYSHSGPLLTKVYSNYKPTVNNKGLLPHLADPQYKSGPVSRSHMSCAFVSPRISPSVSPPHLSPPHTNELHKLPTPPPGMSTAIHRSASLIPQSAPLGKSTQESSLNQDLLLTLPPPLSLTTRSLSIPSADHSKRFVPSKILNAPAHQKLEARLLFPHIKPIAMKEAVAGSDFLAQSTEGQEK